MVIYVVPKVLKVYPFFSPDNITHPPGKYPEGTTILALASDHFLLLIIRRGPTRPDSCKGEN